MKEATEQVAIGKRLKAAAVQAGQSAYELARQLGVRPATVYRWWYGERQPSSEMMLAYARLVGQSAAYFYGQEEEELVPQFSDFLLRWANLLMAGEEPGTAFDRVTGEPEELTPRERQRLATAATQMRDQLATAAGGDWDLLSEDQQREILQQIAQLADQRRTAVTSREH